MLNLHTAQEKCGAKMSKILAGPKEAKLFLRDPSGTRFNHEVKKKDTKC